MKVSWTAAVTFVLLSVGVHAFTVGIVLPPDPENDGYHVREYLYFNSTVTGGNVTHDFSYHWTADCGVRTFEAGPGRANHYLHFRAPAEPATCRVTVMVTGGPEPANAQRPFGSCRGMQAAVARRRQRHRLHQRRRHRLGHRQAGPNASDTRARTRAGARSRTRTRSRYL